MNELLRQAREIVQKTSEIVSQTLEREVDKLLNYEEQAKEMLTKALGEARNSWTKLTEMGEAVQKCIEKKQPEIAKIETQLKNTLVECYKKHYAHLDTLRAERAKIHESAVQLKLGAEQMLEKCMSAAEPLQCFQQSLADLAKKAEALAKEFAAHVRKETEIAMESAKLVRQCSERAVAESQKKYSKLIEEVKKCAK